MAELSVEKPRIYESTFAVIRLRLVPCVRIDPQISSSNSDIHETHQTCCILSCGYTIGLVRSNSFCQAPRGLLDMKLG